MIIVGEHVSRIVFPILIVHHFLCRNPHKMSIVERSIACSFFRNCNDIMTRTHSKMFEDTFLVKIANKGTSLNGEF